jgi:hypothetical protein
MRHLIRLAVVMVALLSAGTALAQPPSDTKITDLFPLKMGTKWVYNVGDNEVTVTVVGTERFNNENYFKMETQVGRDRSTSELFVVRSDGVYRVQVKDDKIAPPIKILALPVKKGDSWVVNSKIGIQTIKGTLQVVNDKELVKIPAGEFTAVFVEGVDMDFNGIKTTVRIWFAKDRGIIKQEFVLQNNEKVTLELVRFEAGSDPPAEAVVVQPWVFQTGCNILPRCVVVPVTTQECCGCCARFGRRLGRR